jgi:hypothetical protein
MRRLVMIAFALVAAPVIAMAQDQAALNPHAEHASVMTPPQDWAKAQLDKSPRHQEWVMVKNGARTVNSFIVYPEVKNKATAVVVIHEIFGMTDWVRSVADQLAAAGYIAIAPDLLSGMGPNGGGSSEFTDRNAVTQAVGKLAPDQVTGDLNAAADYVAKPEFQICHESAEACSGVRLLWHRSGQGRDGKDRLPGLWVLCRQRRPGHPNGSQEHRPDERGRQEI